MTLKLPLHSLPPPARGRLRRRLVFLWVLLLAALLLAPMAVSAAKVTYLVKPAEVKRRGTQKWIALEMGDKVGQGDTVRTGFGARLELSITRKRQFRISQATEIYMDDLEEEKPRSGLRARVSLLLGRFWGSIRTPLSSAFGERVEVATPTATIGVKGTSFGVDHDKETQDTRVAVINGSVEVNPPPKEAVAPTEIEGPREVAPPQEVSREAWTALVGADQKLVIRPGEAPRTEPLTEEDKKDEWVAFNIQRDLSQ